MRVDINIRYNVYCTLDEDCDRSVDYDYDEVHVLVNRKIVVKYADHYHDKGLDKSEGFVDAIKYLHKDATIFQNEWYYDAPTKKMIKHSSSQIFPEIN